MSFDLVIIIVAAVPATLAVILYGVGAKWWRSWPGVAFLSSMLSVALLLDLTLLFYWATVPLDVQVTISHIVILAVAVASWLKLTAVVREQYRRRRSRR